MATPTLKQQKTFAMIRILGGFAAALVLADVAGFPARRAASEAKGFKRGLGYSAYYTRTLSRIAEAEKGAAAPAQKP